jgi:sarcosine/dimethylglycine N-methyltransferase
MTYNETDVVTLMKRLAGGQLSALTQEQWNRLDQFHSGGSEAVDLMLTSLHLAPGMTVLDVGSGFGGPARQAARNTGCTVVGVDITPAYVDAANALTLVAGLSGQVTFFCSGIGAFDQRDFDAAFTMHVQMNVALKESFFSEIAKRVRPGAYFATFEVCRSGTSEPAPPLPWSLDGADSFLSTPDELRATIQSSGFDVLEWVDESAWVRRWFADVGGQVATGGTQATLSAVLTDGPIRMRNLAAALSAGVVTVHRGSFTRR